MSVQLQGGKLTVSSDGSDGFLSTLLSNSNIDANFNVGVTWSPSQGIAFVASAGLEIQVPAPISRWDRWTSAPLCWAPNWNQTAPSRWSSRPV